MSSIKLHKEHGLNPTMPVCFWCGNEKGEIAFLGSAYKGEAPRTMLLNYDPCINYDPCTECEELMAQGITFMEAEPRQPNEKRVPMQVGTYPTGRWWVLKEESVKELVKEPALSEALRCRKMFIDPHTASLIFDEPTEN